MPWLSPLLILLSFAAYGQSSVRFDHLTTQDGLSQSTINCMLRDSRGYMWFGTNDGLNRYDGYQFSVYRPTDSDSAISHNTVLSLVEDQQGNLWIGTANGLNYYNVSRNTFTSFFHDPADSHSLVDNRITHVFLDRRQQVWIGTQQGLSVYYPAQQRFKKFSLPFPNPAIQSLLEDSRGSLWVGTSQGLLHYARDRTLLHTYQHDPADARSLSDNYVFKVFEDGRGNLWIGTRTGGLNLLDREAGTFRHFQYSSAPGSISNDRIKDIALDTTGQLWVATFEGLNRYDYASQTFETFTQDLARPDGLTHFHIWSLYNDPQGILWIGTYAGGANLYSPFHQQFRYQNPASPLSGGRLFGKIGPMVEHQGRLWIASEGGGLISYHPSTGQYRFFTLPSEEPPSVKNNIIKALTKDRHDQLWIGTHDEGLHVFDLNTQQFVKHYPLNDDPPSSLGMGTVASVYEDQQGYWVGTHELLNHYDPQTKNFQHAFYDAVTDTLVSIRGVKAITEDTRGNVYFGTSTDGLWVYYRDERRFAHIRSDARPHQLPSNWIQTLFCDSQGDIWIGTNQGVARWNVSRDTFTGYRREDGLLGNNICSIEEDRHGFMWIGTLTGLSRLDPRSGTILSYSQADHFPIDELNAHASLRTSDGQLYFGGNNGFVSFDPLKMIDDAYVPRVVLSDLRIFNESVPVGGASALLEQPISQTQALTFNHRQNVFTLEFFSTNLISSEENQYAFRLEGLEESWNEVGTRRTATYTNLAPGAYTFLVKTASQEGVWSQAPTAVRITVLSPPWKTWWAYSSYVLVIALTLLALRYYWSVKANLEKNLSLEQLEHRKSEEVHRAKTEFFTNVSHEFRTPLTLILGPLQSILHRGTDEISSPEVKQQLHLVEHNARRLLRLVNQLLDLSKYETGHLRLQVAEGNLVKFVHEIFLSFTPVAAEKSIDYRFTAEADALRAWYDRDQLEKVFFNLLSNAFKFTAKGEKISLRVAPTQRDGHSFIRIAIQDTGAGIPRSQLDKIFERFYQGTNAFARGAGTGIGLSLAKSIVGLHHGRLDVESEPGVGTTFCVCLPTQRSHFADDEIIADFRDSEAREYYTTDEAKAGNEHTAGVAILLANHPAPTVLVVEDNADVRAYVCRHLRGRYHVLEAADGQAGWEVATQKMPDLIISDVMMPVLDGITLCRKVKSNPATAHVPVLLLTARTATVHQKEGLSSGADDYVVKPFNAELLKIKVDNFLASRHRLRNLLGKEFDLPQLGIDVGSADDDFLKKLMQVVSDNLSDPRMSVEELAHQIGYSRSQVHRKLKTLTGETVSEFVKGIRLKAAAEILRQSRTAISEVGDQVGFSSAAYFAKCFKEHFGLTPTQYATKYRQSEDSDAR